MFDLRGPSRELLLRQLADSRADAESPSYEIYEGPQSIPRHDLPVQLENRGTTTQEKPQSAVSREALHQSLLWSKQTIHKNTIAAKLRSIGSKEPAETLERCHTIFTVAQCQKCGTVQKFPNRCDRFYCPECQPRLANERRKAVEWWTKEISQPKHVVLTVKNTSEITTAHVHEFRGWFTKLRRSKFARNWVGGFYSLEVTNEGNGWHLHLHALINARFIDQNLLSEIWQRVTNGFGRIVHVSDARRVDYLRECTKYAVKGSQLAAWTPAQISEFIAAFSGIRTFGVFGDLYGKRTQFAEWFKIIRNLKPPCKCGACSMLYFSEAEFLERDFVPLPQTSAIPPPPAPDLHTPYLFSADFPLPPR